MTLLNRRQFAGMLTATAAAPLLGGCQTSSGNNPAATVASPWLNADEIKLATQLPSIAKRDFLVEDYGARADANTDCSAAIARAISACHEAGGGRVVCGQGVYRTGPVHLKSNVELHVAKGSELSFYTEPERFLPAVFTRWEGMEMYGYSPLVYAFEQDNVAVTGGGVLNGNADADTWWPWKGKHAERDWNYYPEQDQKAARTALFAQAEAGEPVANRQYAEGSFLRPSFIQFYRCNKVLIADITITAAPFWLVHPVLCEDVTVRGISCVSHGPNSDGCDPESCNRVVIEDCIFDTGDDCIAVKSGRNNDGRRIGKPCENILIQNCTMRAGHGGIVMGSEISGGVRNLHARNCVMSSPELERAIRIKTNAARGGTIEHIRYQDIQVGVVRDAVVVNFYYEEGPDGDFMPTVKDVEITGLSVQQASKAFVLRGFPDNPVSGLKLQNCTVYEAQSLGVIENVSQIQLRSVSVNGKLLDARQISSA